MATPKWDNLSDQQNLLTALQLLSQLLRTTELNIDTEPSTVDAIRSAASFLRTATKNGWNF